MNKKNCSHVSSFHTYDNKARKTNLMLIDSHNEEQTGISPIDQLVVHVFDKRTLVFVSRQTFTDNFSFECRSLVNGFEVGVLGESRLTLLVHQKDEFNGHCVTLFCVFSLFDFLFLVGKFYYRNSEFSYDR